MSGLNRWQGIIALGADAELRFTQGGQAVLNFRGACTEKYKDRDNQQKEIVTWISCVLWGKRGEALAKMLTKGTRLYVEGALRISSFDDRDGNKKWKTEIHIAEVEFVGGNRPADTAEQSAPGTGQGERRSPQQGSRSPSVQRHATTQPAAQSDGDYSDGGYGVGHDDSEIPF